MRRAAVLVFFAVCLGPGRARAQDTTLTALPVTYPSLSIHCDAGGTGSDDFHTEMNNGFDSASIPSLQCEEKSPNLPTWIIEKGADNQEWSELNSVTNGNDGYRWTGGDNNFKGVVTAADSPAQTVLCTNTNPGDLDGSPVQLIARDFDPINCGLGPTVDWSGGGNKPQVTKSSDSHTYAFGSGDDATDLVALGREEVANQNIRRQIRWPLVKHSELGTDPAFFVWVARMAYWVEDSNDAPTIDAGTVVIPSQTRNDAHDSAPRTTAQMLDDRNWADQDAGMGYCVYKTLVVTGGTIQGGGTWRMDPAGSSGFADFDVTQYSGTSALIVEPGTKFRYRSDGTAGIATLSFRAFDGTEYGYDANTAAKQTTIDTSSKRGGKFPTSTGQGTLSYEVLVSTTGTTGDPTTATTGTTGISTTTTSTTSTNTGAMTSSSTSSGSTSSGSTSSGSTSSGSATSGSTTQSDVSGDDESSGSGLVPIWAYAVVGAVFLCCILAMAIFFLVRSRRPRSSSSETDDGDGPPHLELVPTTAQTPDWHYEAADNDRHSSEADSGGENHYDLIVTVLKKAGTPTSASRDLIRAPDLAGERDFAALAGAEEAVTGSHYQRVPVSAMDSQANTSNSTIPLLCADEVMLDTSVAVAEGNFGYVFRGRVRNVDVAVKVLKDDFTSEQLQGFFDEAQIIAGLPPHDNIVGFIGVVPDPFMIITEFMNQGSLLRFLRSGETITLTMAQGLQIARQIAVGMAHLHQYHIIHRDLAARTVLLDDNLVPKIADFGMSRQLDDASQQHQTKSTAGPVRWMAMETIRSGTFSEKSDVWSFAVTAWETLNQGQIPYGDNLTSLEAAHKVMKGKRLYFPDTIPKRLRTMFESCMEADPGNRPSFSRIVKRMDSMEGVDSGEEEIVYADLSPFQDKDFSSLRA